MGVAISSLSGVLLWSGFGPLEFSLGPYIGMALLFRALLDRPIRIRLINSLVAGSSFFLPLLHWSSSYVGWIPWVSLAILQTLIFALIGLVPLRRNFSSVALFAASFTLIELIRMKYPFGGFGWGRVGHTQVELLSGLYSLVGIAGISFIVALIAALISLIRTRFAALLPLPILVSVLTPGIASTDSLRIIAVQGGVDELGFDYNSRALSVLKRHADTTRLISDSPHLVIWPENASDIDPIASVEAARLISETLEVIKTPLLVGAVLRDDLGPKNVSILYDKDSKISSMYVKQDLAPFGEYMPIRSIAEFIAPEAKRVRDFQPGDRWVAHEIGGKKFQAVICFEVLDDDFLRAGLNDSQFAVAQTNNATFGRSPQAKQQLQIIRARAAEFQRDFAVVSTTGFTAHVNARGEIVDSLDQFDPGLLEMEVATRSGETIASRLGSWVWVGIFVLALIVSRRSVFAR